MVAERDILIQVAAADAVTLAGQAFFVRIGSLRMGMGGMMVQMPVRCPIVIPIDTIFMAVSGVVIVFFPTACGDLCLSLGDPGIVRFGTD